MKTSAKLLAFICLIVCMGHLSLAQNDTSSNKITITNGDVRIIIDKSRADSLPDDFFSGLKSAPKFNRRTKMGYNSLAQDNDSDRIAKIVELLNKTFSGPVDMGTNGDYTQIQYTMRMNRPGKYKLGEPIFVCRFAKNMSNSNLFIRIAPPIYRFFDDKVTLVDGDGNDVSMTRAGKRLDEWVAKFDNPSYILSHPGAFHRFSYFNQDGILVTSQYKFETDQLESQVEMELKPGPIVLNHYFDLTRPGIYHLTFHRIAFHEAQRYDEPLTSNTLTFEILDEFVTPDDLRDPGEFNWPPPETTIVLPATQPPDVAKPPAE